MKVQQKIFILIPGQADRFELKRVLGRAGYEVVVGKPDEPVSEQITLVNPDVSIIDQALVEDEGEQLQKYFPDKPIIAWTTKRDARAAVTLIAGGAFDCINPPVRPAEVLGVIEHALKKALKRREVPPFVERHLQTMLVSLAIVVAAVAVAVAVHFLMLH